MITFVTAFLHGYNPLRSYEAYLGYFQKLASTGIPIVLFLDKKSEWTSFPDNVIVQRVSLEDTWIGQTIPEDVILPNERYPKDTRQYMMIQNTKTEWLVRARQMNPYNTEWFAWIDFGIVHVFKNPNQTLATLASSTPPSYPCIRSPGGWGPIWPIGWHCINWRFLGGFLLIHESLIDEFHQKVKERIIAMLPNFAWEVNAWASAEEHGINIEWYFSEHHDDKMVDFAI